MEKPNQSVAKFGGIVCFVYFCLIITFDTLTAQISQGGEPHSFGHTSLEEPERITMPAVDVQALRMEDQLERESPTPVPPRFGFAHEVNLDIHRNGTWTELEDGGRFWRLSIHTAGAYSVNLIFDEFLLPPEATFFVYNGDRTEMIGAFTELNNKEYGKFSTSPVAGDVTILEVYEPAGVRGLVRLRISHVVHAYRNLFNRTRGSGNDLEPFSGHGSSLSCNIGINCSKGAPYQNEKRAIAMILTQNGQRICSGSLLNNVRQDYTPYFLTADHCRSAGNVNTWLFMFNYESPGCTTSDGQTHQSISGATLRANHAASDFALLQLSSQLPATYNLYLLGWSAQNQSPQSSTIIHHPRGDTKKISFDYNSAVSASFLGSPPNTHWRIELTDGTAEPGSSGAPQLNQNKRVVGQIHGGPNPPHCPNPTTPIHNGRFDVSWTGGGSNSTRLRTWLDPDNTGSLTLNGRYAQPHPPQNFVITNAGTQAPPQLAWNANTEDDLSHYQVWRRVLVLESQFQLIATTTATSYTDNSGFQDSQGYETRYYVRAVNNHNRISLPSNHYTVYLQMPQLLSRTADVDEAPVELSLHPNYPNPFNPTTTIRFDLPQTVHVRLTVYDMLGRKVARLSDQVMPAGEHQTAWDARSNPSGMYILRLEAGAHTHNRTMLLLK